MFSSGSNRHIIIVVIFLVWARSATKYHVRVWSRLYQLPDYNVSYQCDIISAANIISATKSISSVKYQLPDYNFNNLRFINSRNQACIRLFICMVCISFEARNSYVNIFHTNTYECLTYSYEFLQGGLMNNLYEFLRKS